MTDFYKHSLFSVLGKDAAKYTTAEYIGRCNEISDDKLKQGKNVEKYNELTL